MEKQSDIFNKIKDYSLERTFEEQEKILDYQKKALELLKKVFDHQLDDKKEFLYSKEMNLDLAKLGYFLEKNESIEDLKELKENEQEIDNIIEGISNKLELKFEKDNDIVLLDERLIEQELVAQSKLEGNTKEKILDGAFQNENGQIASSLVVDVNKEKIKETVSALNDRLNPINKYPAPKFNSKKSSNKDEKRKKFEETYINNFIQKQSRGLVLDTETFSHTNTILEPSMVMVNIKGIRDKSLNLNEERPNAVIGNSGLITERRRVI